MTDLDTCLCIFFRSWDEILDKFIEFISFAEIQSGKKLKALRSDNAAFEQLLLNSGIKGQQIVPHIPQQNGVAERAKKALYLAPHNIWC